jgi:alanine dehydrogenase
MIIGSVKEIKNRENRVGLTPAGVKKLASAGNKVLIQKGAGIGSGFSDKEYIEAGAKILPTAQKVWESAEMIVKIKEPLHEEFKFLRKDLILFTYLHLAAEEKLTKELIKKQVMGIAYETVELTDKSLPLLKPMSEVAGRMATQVGAHFLEKTNGGKGVLLGGVTGVNPGTVTVLGSGTVGYNAMQMAYGLGANVIMFGRDKNKLEKIKKSYPKIKIMVSKEENIKKVLPETDLLIGAVLVTGAKAPKIVTKKMISLMSPGSVFVDVSIDQGGISETSRTTSHTEPVYNICSVMHYCVPNIPGAVPRTSTLAITQVTLPYILKMAKQGVMKAIKSDEALAKGVNTYKGKLTIKPVADVFKLKYDELESIID